MEITVFESDQRMTELKNMLAGKSAPLYVYAPNINVNENMLSDIAEGSSVVLGKYTDAAKEWASSHNITLYNIMLDEKFQAVNSRLSAEGALMIMLTHSKKSVAECKVLVVGMGRMGAAIVRLLGNLNISMDIVSSKPRTAYAFAERVIELEGADLSCYDVIINTVPLPVISDRELLTISDHAVYIDLASKPALNLEYAKYLGLDADIYPALPAKVCPVSAAKAMFDYIMEAALI